MTGNVGAITSTGTITTTGTVVMGSSFLRNRIINGDMRIDQRNAGASVTPTDGQYVIDRWKCGLTAASKYSAQQNAGAATPPAGFKNYFGVTSLSAYSVGAGDVFGVQQVVEGFNAADFGWGAAGAATVTLSFWVRSSLTGTFGGSFRNSASNRSYPFTYTISAANTWEQKSITVAGDTSGTWLSDNGAGIVIQWGLGGGSTYSGTAGTWASANYGTATGAVSVVGTNGATFYLTGVQLEVGSVATPFERRQIGQEILLCQRYYCKTFSLGTAPANNSTSVGALKGATRNGSANEPSANWKFPASMRTEPTVTLYNTGSGTAGQWSNDGGSTASANARSQWISTENCAIDNTGVAFNNVSNIQAVASAEL